MKKNRYYKILIGAISCAFFLYSFWQAYLIKTLEIVPTKQSYYYLVSTSKNVSASTKNAYFQGGAGYLLENDGKKYAVYSVYDTLTKAERSRENLSERNLEVKTLRIKTGDVYLKGKNRRKKAEIRRVLETLSISATILSDLSRGAEDGRYSQSRLREMLEVVKGSLNAFKKGEFVYDYAKEGRQKIEKMQEGIVYAKDVRYVEVLLCDCYQKFCAKFPIYFV